MSLNLEVPKLEFVIGQSIPNVSKKFIIFYKNNITQDDMNKFLSYGKCVFFESWHQNITDYDFDYYFINLNNPKSENFIKTNNLNNYNIIYHVENNNEFKKLSDQFRDNPNINVLKKIPDEQQFKDKFDKLLMYGAVIGEVILPELKKPSLWRKLLCMV